MSAGRLELGRLRARLAGRGRGLVPALLLVAAYLAAQAVAVTHDLGPEGHPAGEICAICVTFGTPGAVDAAPAGTAPPAGTHEAAAAAGHVLALALRAAAYDARAPPGAS